MRNNSLREVNSLSPLPILVVYPKDFASVLSPTNRLLMGMVGTNFGVESGMLYLPVVGELICPWEVCQVESVCVFKGRACCVCSLLGLG